MDFKEESVFSAIMNNRKLTIAPDFVPYQTDDEDEIYANGIFRFNITKLSEYISSNPGLFSEEEVFVKEIYRESPHINESHLDSVDVSKPVILAEIAPGRYNLIDGNHRVEKAFRLGIEKIRAFRIHPEHHHRFISNRQGYEKYVDYWNQGLKEAQEAAKRRIPMYQLKILLTGSMPPIWRRVLVPMDMPLKDFHLVIQTVMGWENSHLHAFMKDGTTYQGEISEEDKLFSSNLKDYKGIRISDLLTEEKEKINYVYDFGDDWHHVITLEKTFPNGTGFDKPICSDGAMNTPPEDCGGIPVYHKFLHNLKKKKYGW